MTPHKPGLIVHTFLPAPGQSDAMPEALTELWSAVRELGMDSAIGALPLDPQPADTAEDRLVMIAARRREVPGGYFEAIAYRLDDVIGVSVLLAPNDDGISWAALEGSWTAQVPGSVAGTLGTVTTYIGLWPDRRTWWRGERQLAPAREAERLRAAVPVPGTGTHDWTDAWSQTSDGLLLWELPAEDDSVIRRRLLAMGRPRDEAAMDRWTWLSYGHVLPPLTRYLLHGVKLRHQRQVLEEAIPRLRTSITHTERACETLIELLRTQEPPADQLLTASRALATVQAEQGGLIASAADAADLAETARALRRNMETALGDGESGQPGGPFDNDRAIADWLDQQLRIELNYLRSAQHKAAELARLAAAVVDERQRRRQESLTLLQTSLIGALLMALAAIQSFEYRVPLPKPLVGPLVCVLAATALLLPAAVLRWPGRGDGAPVTRRYAAGAGLFGAALGWLATTTAWRLSTEAPAPPVWSVLVAVGGGLLAALVAALLTRRR